MIREALAELVGGHSLSRGLAAEAMLEIMSGEATGAQIGAFVIALRLKGETVDEVVGLASAMRQKAITIDAGPGLLDTAGTGGDGKASFNVSTAAALVASAAGARVAKHGNRGASSACGSADVLEALGVAIDLGPAATAAAIRETGFGFLFAPLYHPSMAHAGPVRKELGIRTVFNLLGPLSNPAGAQYQIVGAPDPRIAGLLAQALCELGCQRALVFNGEDGLDELTVSGKTRIWEVEGGAISNYWVDPLDWGLARSSLEAIRGGSATVNAEITRGVLEGESGPRRDVVILNAAAGLMVAGMAASWAEGLALAGEAIDSGRAGVKLGQVIAFGQSRRA